MSTTYKDRIRLKARAIGIPFLCHFTQAINLENIMRHGLLSRVDLDNAGLPYYESTPVRIDGNYSAISVSISRVNHAMFDAKRRKSGHLDWVALALSPKILWTHDCQFAWQNAATKEIKDRRWRGGDLSFDLMFSGSADQRSGLKAWEPTDSAAEVQVLQSIDPSLIIEAVVCKPAILDAVDAILNGTSEAKRKVSLVTF